MELLQNKKVLFLLSALAAAGGATALLVYLETRKTRIVSDQILYLDKQIKELDLAHKKHRNSAIGL